MDPDQLDISILVEQPFSGLSPPYATEDYFELFYRLDQLMAERNRLREVHFDSEEQRQKSLKAVLKAIESIERHVKSEKFGRPAGGKRGQIQEQLILDELHKQGFDASQLKPPTGKSGPKKSVANALLKSHPNYFKSRAAFDNVWRRLRSSRVIK